MSLLLFIPPVLQSLPHYIKMEPSVVLVGGLGYKIHFGCARPLRVCYCVSTHGWTKHIRRLGSSLPVFSSWAPGVLCFPPGCRWSSGCHWSLDGCSLTAAWLSDQCDTAPLFPLLPYVQGSPGTLLPSACPLLFLGIHHCASLWLMIVHQFKPVHTLYHHLALSDQHLFFQQVFIKYL